MSILIDKWILIQNNCGSKSFLNETKASMSFIPMSRMSVWCTIIKRKEIIMRIHVWAIDKRTLILKNGGKRSLSYETKASMLFIPMSRMSLWFLIMKWKEIICESIFVLIDKQNLTIKKVGRKAFLMKQKHECHLSQWRERVYGSQSWNEKRLLWESMFVTFDKWTLILRK